MGNLNKREKRLLVVLSVAVTLFLLNMFVFSSEEEQPAPAQTRLERIESSPNPAVKSNFKTISPGVPVEDRIKNVLAAKTLDSDIFTKWKRDPFLGAFKQEILDSLQERPPEEFVLKAISWRDSTAYVILNDDVYREGESKNGIHVIDVIGKRVYFSYNGKKRILSFGDSNEN